VSIELLDSEKAVAHMRMESPSLFGWVEKHVKETGRFPWFSPPGVYLFSGEFEDIPNAGVKEQVPDYYTDRQLVGWAKRDQKWHFVPWGYRTDGLPASLSVRFVSMWKTALLKYRRKNRELMGVRRARADTAAESDLVRLEKLMSIAGARLRDSLDTYIAQVQGRSLTDQQIGQLYRELVSLAALNKKYKKMGGRRA
jgi:hypothetical protein